MTAPAAAAGGGTGAAGAAGEGSDAVGAEVVATGRATHEADAAEVVAAAAAGSAGAAADVAGAVDVIVVGAGGSGAPLAARLSDDPGCRVLVLEAGPVPSTEADFPAELLDAAGLRGADPGHPDTWAHPAQLTATRPYVLARGRILGGSTTINGAYFVRARRADHDAWVAAGLTEWGFDECLPFWRALESDQQYGASPLHGATGPMPVHRTVDAAGQPVRSGDTDTDADGHRMRRGDTDDQRTGRGAVAVEGRRLQVHRGADGRRERDNDVGRGEGALCASGSGGGEVTITTAFAQACRALGFGVEADKNGAQPPGWGPLPMNVKGGIRWNTGLAYLVPLLGVRPNLEVRGGARVQRVVFEGTRAVGVEYVTDEGRHVVVRAGEVVLAAGAIGSPTILLRSGIGPVAQLARHGIAVVADSPVGAAFSDHPQITLRWRPRTPSTTPPPAPASTPPGPATSSAATPERPSSLGTTRPPHRPTSANGTSGTGAGSTVLGTTESPHPTSAGIGGTVLESVLNVESAGGGDVELLPLMRPVEELLGGVPAPEPVFSVLVAVQNPESRGELRLADEGGEHPPVLDYHSLSAPADALRMRSAVRLAAALLETPAFREVSAGLADLDRATIDDDGRLDAWIRANIGTALHLCGSAPMGAEGDDRAVVDPHGRVRGVMGLRVADLSIIPTVPSRGPAATAVLVGERIAAFLRAGT